MSIYIFKTEEFYGGKTCVFTNKNDANVYLAEYLTATNGKIDAIIEEHKPIHSTPLNRATKWIISLSLIREDGWDVCAENVRWVLVD